MGEYKDQLWLDTAELFFQRGEETKCWIALFFYYMP